MLGTADNTNRFHLVGAQLGVEDTNYLIHIGLPLIQGAVHLAGELLIFCREKVRKGQIL